MLQVGIPLGGQEGQKGHIKTKYDNYMMNRCF